MSVFPSAFLDQDLCGMVREGLASAPSKERFTDAQAESLYARAYDYIVTERWSEAIDHLQLLLFYRPDQARYLRALALAFRKSERLSDALTTQRMIDVLAPGDPVNSLDLAETLIAMGQGGAAYIALEMAKHRSGSSPAHTQIHERAQALQTLLSSADFSQPQDLEGVGIHAS